MNKEILYIDSSDSCSYIHTESAIIRNIASMVGGDIGLYLSKGNIIGYFPDEYEPLLDLLKRSGIDYSIEYKHESWFEKQVGFSLNDF